MAEGIKANMIMQFGSLESIKQCIKNGLGISLLPRIVVEGEIKRGEIVRLCMISIFPSSTGIVYIYGYNLAVRIT